MSVLSLALAAVTLAGSPAEARTVDGPEAAAAICRATQPMVRAKVHLLEQDAFRARKRRVLAAEYEASLPLTQFDLSALDEAEREVTFARRDVLRPAPGVQLFFAEQDLTLQLEGGAEKVGGPSVAKLAGELLRDEGATLHLRYALSDGDGAGPCPTMVKRGSRPLLMIEPLAWELKRGDGALVAQGNGLARNDRRTPPGGRPQVAIAPATVDGDGPPASQVTERARLVGNAAHACYEAGLAKDARLEGTLVLRVEIDGSGATNVLDVTADTLNAPEVAACLTGLFQKIDWGRGGPGIAIVPVLLERR